MSDKTEQEPALVAGSIIGFRLWRVEMSQRNRLLAMTSDFVWRGRHNTALCLRHKSFWGGSVIVSDHTNGHTTHPAPQEHCTCGLYARHNPFDMNDVVSYAMRSTHVIGIVKATGKVINGERGFRSEKMEIIGLAPSPYSGPPTQPTMRLLKHIGYAYGVSFSPNLVELLLDNDLHSDEYLSQYGHYKELNFSIIEQKIAELARSFVMSEIELKRTIAQMLMNTGA